MAYITMEINLTLAQKTGYGVVINYGETIKLFGQDNFIMSYLPDCQTVFIL